MEGTCFDEDWAAVAASEAALQRVIGRLHQAGSERLGPMFGDLDRDASGWPRRRRSGCWTEGLSRGDVRASDAASPAGWVRQWAPTVCRRRCRGAGAGDRGDRQALQRAAGRGGARGPGAGVATPRSRIAEMDELRPRLTPECHDTVLDGFVALAEGQGPREIRALRPALIAKYGHLGEFQRREDRLKHGTALSQPYDDDGMAEYRLRLDPEGSGGAGGDPRPAGRAATLAPSTGRTCAPATSAGPTRWSRSAAAPPPPAGPRRPPPKAAVVVTMGYQDLLERDRGRDDADRGAARPRDGPADRLRRRDHPGRPGVEG